MLWKVFTLLKSDRPEIIFARSEGLVGLINYCRNLDNGKYIGPLNRSVVNELVLVSSTRKPMPNPPNIWS